MPRAPGPSERPPPFGWEKRRFPAPRIRRYNRPMLGYLLTLVALIAVVAILLPVLSARRAPRPDGGTLESDHPVARTKPAADEVTPADSVTATSAQQENAGRRTPPS